MKNSASVLVARSNSLFHRLGSAAAGQAKNEHVKKSAVIQRFFYVWVKLLAALFASSAYALNCPPQHIDESARVNYVYDGDTLQLEDGRKIRMLGIDSPETFTRQGSLQPDIKVAGEKAKAALQQQLNASRNKISLAFGPQRFDRYGRTLAHVFLPDGSNLQAGLIAQGYAIAFTTPPNDRMSPCYRELEAQAMQANRGIWQLPRYQLRGVNQLSKESEGFYRIQAVVTRIWQGNFAVTVFLDNRLEVKILNYDLANFNVYMLNQLMGKSVIIRGWVQQKKWQENRSDTPQNKLLFSMNLRHPDNIKGLK